MLAGLPKRISFLLFHVVVLPRVYSSYYLTIHSLHVSNYEGFRQFTSQLEFLAVCVRILISFARLYTPFYIFLLLTVQLVSKSNSG